MPAEARVTIIWKRQKLFIACFLLGIGLWFFVDGKWTWPRSNQRWKAHDQFEKEKRLGEWPAYAKAQGWKAEAPHKYYDADAILMQFIIASAATLGGAITLLYWMSQKDRVVRSDDAAIYSPSGTKVPWDAVSGLGLKRWEAKGIATVRYEIEGRKGAFQLDDYKYERDPIHAMVKALEEHLLTRPKA